MANSSCEGSSSGQDSPLSITSNLIGILTFVYALAAGLYFYASLARSSSQRKRESLVSLRKTLREARVFAVFLEQQQQSTSSEIYSIQQDLDETIQQLYLHAESLAKFPSNDIKALAQRPWYGRVGYRLKFVLLREELEKGEYRKDRLMEDLRRLYTK